MSFQDKRNVMHKVLFLEVLCTIIVILPQACGIERKLNAQINPGCLDECNQSSPITVAYVRANGPDDTVHFLWDFEGKPSLLFALTSLFANVTIDWHSFLYGGQNSVSFTEKPSYTFGIILNRIFEFDDLNNTGSLDISDLNSSYVRELDTKDFDWKRTSFLQDESKVLLSVRGTHATRTGAITLSIYGFGFVAHSENVPHLLHSANTSVVEMEIDGLETDASFSNSRFAVEFLLASSDPVAEATTLKIRKSLNDEQCPGVFELVDLVTPSCQTDPGGGYLQWRPVAYVARTRSLANSTETRGYGVEVVGDATSDLRDTLLGAYYGSDLVDDVPARRTVVSFGGPDDGFYKKTNYTSWAFAMGFGHPPDENFSLLVMLVIGVGLGLPAVLIVVSGVVFGVRRCTRKKDELCLSR